MVNRDDNETPLMGYMRVCREKETLQKALYVLTVELLTIHKEMNYPDLDPYCYYCQRTDGNYMQYKDPTFPCAVLKRLEETVPADILEAARVTIALNEEPHQRHATPMYLYQGLVMNQRTMEEVQRELNERNTSW
jgi:hypothetical protein